MSVGTNNALQNQGEGLKVKDCTWQDRRQTHAERSALCPEP